MAIMAQEISSGDTSGKGQLSLTFVVSEAVTDFQHHDIISTNGEIVAFDGSGTMYYGTFIPATEGPCSIGVDEDSFHGANGAGNVPTTFNWTHRLGGKHMCFMGETYTQIYNGTPELVVIQPGSCSKNATCFWQFVQETVGPSTPAWNTVVRYVLLPPGTAIRYYFSMATGDLQGYLSYIMGNWTLPITCGHQSPTLCSFEFNSSNELPVLPTKAYLNMAYLNMAYRNMAGTYYINISAAVPFQECKVTLDYPTEVDKLMDGMNILGGTGSQTLVNNTEMNFGVNGEGIPTYLSVANAQYDEKADYYNLAISNSETPRADPAHPTGVPEICLGGDSGNPQDCHSTPSPW